MSQDMDLIQKHFVLFNDVMNMCSSSSDVVFCTCATCNFFVSYKNHSRSFESAVIKTMKHILDTHR